MSHFEIKSIFGKVLFSTEAESFREFLADLRGADLSGDDLSGADLSGAYLRGADLRGADLRGADLRDANLRGANLSGDDLSGADLSGAYLRGAYLRGADLSGAYLRGADLSGAYLRGADLRGADLRGASLPAPTMVLLAQWVAVSDELCADLMLYDAQNHPDPTAFDRWANEEEGWCPYDGVKVQRAASFSETRKLWGKGVACRPYDLMQRVLAEKCPEWSEEKTEEFKSKFRKEGSSNE